jgi:hypothetical protein
MIWVTRKKSFLVTELVRGWCSLLGSWEKRLLFVGVAYLDLMGSYHSRQIAIFLLGFLRLLMISSWEHEQFGIPGFGVVVLRLTDW